MNEEINRILKLAGRAELKSEPSKIVENEGPIKPIVENKHSFPLFRTLNKK